MTDRELMQQALHTLEGWANHGKWVWPESALEQAKRNTTESIAALRERLAQPEQEPVDSAEMASAYMDARLWEFIDMAAAWPEARPDPRTWDHVLVYAPKQRKSLTPQSSCEMTQAERKMFRLGWLECEAAHGIKEQS